MARMIPVALVAIALVAASPAPPIEQVIGISAAVKNDVRIKKAGQPVPRPVLLKQRIALGDAVQTGAKSQLQVLLLDKSVFNVGANARLVIDKFIYDPSKGPRTLGATVSKGAFRFLSGKPDRAGSAQIRTPVASIGIRGTVLEGVVGENAALIASGEAPLRGVRADSDTASLIILRGPGAKTQGKVLPGAITVSAAGRSVDVDRPMMAVFVPGPGRAPIGPFHISPNGLRQVQALLFPAAAQRLGIQGPADNLGGDPGGTYFPPEQRGPDYPGPGRYGPGGYPPGSYPQGGSTPPGMGPGNYSAPGVPNIPRPQAQPQGGQSAGQSPAAMQAPQASPTPTATPGPNDRTAGPANKVTTQDNPQPSPSPTPTATPTPKGKGPR